jgi:hypothetical protein
MMFMFQGLNTEQAKQRYDSLNKGWRDAVGQAVFDASCWVSTAATRLFNASSLALNPEAVRAFQREEARRQAIRDGRPVQRADANETFFLHRELEQVQAEMIRATHAELMGRQIVPSSMEPLMLGQEFYTAAGYDGTGKVSYLKHGTEPLESVTAFLLEQSVKVARYGASFEVTIFDDWAQQFAAERGIFRGRATNSFRQVGIDAARLIVDQNTDILIAYGKADLGLKGFLTLPSSATPTNNEVFEYTLDNGDWNSDTKTVDDIKTDMSNIMSTFWVNSKHRYRVQKLVLPTAAYERLQADVLTGTDTSLLDHFIKTYNKPERGQPFEIMDWNRCDNYAAIGSARPRAVAFFNHPRVVSHASTVSPQLFPPHARNARTWEIEIVEHHGGCLATDTSGMMYIPNTVTAP